MPPGGSYDFEGAEDWGDEEYLDQADRPDLVPPLDHVHLAAPVPAFEPSRQVGRARPGAPRPPGQARPVGSRRAGVAVLSLRVYRLDEPRRCTSTRSITHGPRPSSCRTGATTSPTTSTSGPTRTWPSTPSPAESRSSPTTRSRLDQQARRHRHGRGWSSPACRSRRWRMPATRTIRGRIADARFGDRVFVATGADVRVYDLESRALVQTFEIPGASSLSDVGPSGLLYVGTAQGRIYAHRHQLARRREAGPGPGRQAGRGAGRPDRASTSSTCIPARRRSSWPSTPAATSPPST